MCAGCFRMTPKSDLSEARQVPIGQQHPALSLSHSGIMQDSSAQLLHQVPEEERADKKDGSC